MKNKTQLEEAMARKAEVICELTVADLIRIVELNTEELCSDVGYSFAAASEMREICGNGNYFDTDEIQAELELRTGE